MDRCSDALAQEIAAARTCPSVAVVCTETASVPSYACRMVMTSLLEEEVHNLEGLHPQERGSCYTLKLLATNALGERCTVCDCSASTECIANGN